jgi:hypothetical protein
MKKKTSFAVFTKTGSGLDYMVKGNFGNNEKLAKSWSKNHVNECKSPYPAIFEPKYPNGLFVKKIKY